MPQSPVLLEQNFPFVDSGRVLHSMGFSCSVVEGCHAEKQERVAIKRITKSRVFAASELNRIRREIEIHGTLEHPNIVRLLHGSEDGESFVIVTPLAVCDLASQIKHCCLPELDARNSVSQIGEAVRYLHDQGVVHRDIRPQNVLLYMQGGKFVAKLSDMGHAKRDSADDGDSTEWICRNDSRQDSLDMLSSPLWGCIAYMSPEQFAGSDATKQSDVFALGVLVFAIVAGYEPFGAPLYSRILAGTGKQGAPIEFESRYWAHISASCIDLVRRCMALVPSKRPSAVSFCKDCWTHAESPVPLEVSRYWHSRELECAGMECKDC